MVNDPSTREINEVKNLNPNKYRDFTLVELIQYCIAINNFNVIFGSPQIIEKKVKSHTEIIPIFNRRNLIGYDFKVV